MSQNKRDSTLIIFAVMIRPRMASRPSYRGGGKRWLLPRKEVISMKYTTRKIGRDARTGEFIPVRVAQNRPATTVVETIKVPKKG